jgi:hypothetical protein
MSKKKKKKKLIENREERKKEKRGEKKGKKDTTLHGNTWSVNSMITWIRISDSHFCT